MHRKMQPLDFPPSLMPCLPCLYLGSVQPLELLLLGLPPSRLLHSPGQLGTQLLLCVGSWLERMRQISLVRYTQVRASSGRQAGRGTERAVLSGSWCPAAAG